MLYDQLVYFLIFSTGSGGCGILETQNQQGSTTLIRKVRISLILQPRDHFIHQPGTLREEFICAVCGYLVNLNIKFLAQAERRCFRREDEIRSEHSDGAPKEYGVRTFIPPSLTDSDEYWHSVAAKCFAFLTQLGPPTFFLTFTMNPYWPDHQALERGTATSADSAISAIVFKTRRSALTKWSKYPQILRKVSAFVWRIEYQKRGLPHAHILFWTDFNTHDIHSVKAAINVRYPKAPPFVERNNMMSGFRKLIDSYQIHGHSKRCRLQNGKFRYGHHEEISDETVVRQHNYHLARNSQEINIVPHNPLLLAYFRCHHYFKVIHSNQCIGHALKYCSRKYSLNVSLSFADIGATI
jgi:hypothetical protein